MGHFHCESLLRHHIYFQNHPKAFENPLRNEGFFAVFICEGPEASAGIRPESWYIRWYRASTHKSDTNMSLTELQVRSAKAAEKITKLSDGGGLQLWVTPDGARRWRLAYRFAGRAEGSGNRRLPGDWTERGPPRPRRCEKAASDWFRPLRGQKAGEDRESQFGREHIRGYCDRTPRKEAEGRQGREHPRQDRMAVQSGQSDPWAAENKGDRGARHSCRSPNRRVARQARVGKTASRDHWAGLPLRCCDRTRRRRPDRRFGRRPCFAHRQASRRNRRAEGLRRAATLDCNLRGFT